MWAVALFIDYNIAYPEFDCKRFFVCLIIWYCFIVTVQISALLLKNPLKIASRWDFFTPESCSHGLCSGVQRPA